MVSKYIYFAANNMIAHPLYKQSFILGETDNLLERQHQYNVMQKGIQQIQTGDIISLNGMKDLIFPFVNCFKYTIPGQYTKNKHDTYIHNILKTERPFKDLIYHVKDKSLMNTKEAFAFYSTNDFLHDIERIKEFIIDNLTSYHSYSIIEYKYT